MSLLKLFSSLLGNSKPAQGKILLTQRTFAVGSVCILLLGIGGGVVYKEWQTQSQHQGQIQINNCYLAPTPSATPTVQAKPNFKTVTLPESA
jgi:hypothetical protein